METIYNWLLHNTEDEGNYFTILNTRRHEDAQGQPYLDIMARSKDFEVINLLIYPKQADNTAEPSQDWLKGREIKERFDFSSEQDVITYLCKGTPPESPASGTDIGVAILKPIGKAGAVTFPPEQTI